MLFSYEESTALWIQHMDKDWRDRNYTDKQINKHASFFLKIWDSTGARLPYGEELITQLSIHFPTDKYCKSKFPLEKFKDLSELTHKEIYDTWVARYYEKMINVNGKENTIANFCGRYMMKKWKQEFGTELTVDDVRLAMSLRLYRGAAGMIAEARAHKELTEIYSDSSFYNYNPAEHEDEGTGVDGYSCQASNTNNRIHKYSLKSFRALEDKFIAETRKDKVYCGSCKKDFIEGKTCCNRFKKMINKGKTLPTHYAGYASPADTKLTFKEVDMNGNIRLMFGPPVKR